MIDICTLDGKQKFKTAIQNNSRVFNLSVVFVIPDHFCTRKNGKRNLHPERSEGSHQA